ncbi:MAG: translocation/assembly module TamB [Flavobacteriales bacterium]|nr:translocation/assembly module TamB [Flavobacteriales bacterium]
MTGRKKKWLIGLIIVPVLLLTCGYGAIRSPYVQTKVVQWIAGKLSKKWNTNVSIQGFDLTFFSGFVLEGLYVEDQKGDTLLYVESISAGIQGVSRKEKLIRLESLRLKRPVIHLHKYDTDSVLNFQFILDSLASKDTTKKSKGWGVTCPAYYLENGALSFRNHHAEISGDGFQPNNLRVSKLNLGLEDLNVTEDTITARIAFASLREASGITLDYLYTDVRYDPTRLTLDHTELRTPSSMLKFQGELSYKTPADLASFNNNVRFKAAFEPSRLELGDIAWFAAPLKGIRKRLALSGSFRGKPSELKGRNLKVRFAHESNFEGDVNIKGMPDWATTFIHANITKLETTVFDLEQIPVPPFNEQKTLSLPPQLARLGKFGFTGDFTGFLHEFVAYGQFNTALGSISTDVSLSRDESIRYKGQIRMDQFHVGKFFDMAPKLGRVTMNVKVDGSGIDKDHLKTAIKGNIGHILYAGYDYKQLEVEGYLENQLFSGSLKANDENLDLTFDGSIDYRGREPIFDFVSNIRKARFHTLNLVPEKYAMELQTEARIHLTGDHIDKISGSLDLLRTRIIKDTTSLMVGDLAMNINRSKNNDKISIRSDLLDADVSGQYSLEYIKQSILATLMEYLPSFKPYALPSRLPEQNLEIQATVKNLDDIGAVYFPNQVPGRNTSIIGRYNSAMHTVHLNMSAPSASVGGMEAKRFNASVRSASGILHVDWDCDTLYLPGSSKARNLSFSGEASADTLNYILGWDNQDSSLYTGDIVGSLDFSAYPSFAHVFKKAEITFYDTLWTVASDNRLVFDTSGITINHMYLHSQSQALDIRGKISHNPYNKLLVDFDEFDLRKTDPFLQDKVLVLAGVINGQAALSNLYSNPVISTNIEFKGLRVNEQDIGDGLVNSDWDPDGKKARLRGTFKRNDRPSVNFDGYYYPFETENVLDIHFDIAHIRLNLFNDYVNAFISNLNGVVNGSLDLKGSFKKPVLLGELDVVKTVFNVNYLGTRYNFGSKVKFTEHWMEFDSLVLYDGQNGRGITYGKIFHDGFRNWGLDLSMDLDRMHCLNTGAKDNSLYYGQAYASGLLNVRGDLSNLVVDVLAKPEKGTRINIPLDNPDEVSESGFVMFVNPHKDTLRTKDKDYNVNLDGIQLNMDLEVTPDAEVSLIFDEKVGDVMRGRGNSNLKLEISSKGVFNMYGTYEVTEGDYLFTLQNVINKKFKVKDGGTITWNGNPYDADLDLKAAYGVRTSLSDLFQDTAQAYRKRVPVDCDMYLTGKLLSPDIRFDVSFPNSPEDVRSQAKSLMNTDEEVNRQVFSLLVLYRFTPPLQFGGGPGLGQQSVFEKGAGNTTSELLSHQLSNWISQNSDKYDVNVNYRPGDELTQEEIEVALSTQLFHDRVQLESNVGYAGEQQNNPSRLVGDFNLEYKVREDGKFRVKAFNRSNDFDLLSQEAPYSQGVGLFYREEFNTWQGLMRKVFSGRSSEKKTDAQPSEAEQQPEKNEELEMKNEE